MHAIAVEGFGKKIYFLHQYSLPQLHASNADHVNVPLYGHCESLKEWGT